MESLFRLRTKEIADRLNAMLEVERQPCYRQRDYLHCQPSPPQSRSVRTRSPSRSRRSLSTSQRSQSRSARRTSRCSASTAASTAVSTRASARHSRQWPRSQREQPSITPASRAKIVQWLYDGVDYLELSRECVAVAVGYVDRFMSSSSKVVVEAKNDATVYQLVAVSAVFLAAKQDSNLAVGAVDADVLAKVSHGSYSADEILAMEDTLLDALEWRLCDLTSMGIALHFIALLARQQRRSKDSVDRLSSAVDFTRLQIELSVADYETSVLRRPSEVALAAVLNSMELLDFTYHEKERFGGLLVKGTRMDIHSEVIIETRAELHRVFDTQSNELTSRAAPTFSSRTDKSVSTTASRRTSAASEFATPCSTATGRKRKEERHGRPRSSPACVGARLDNKPKQLEL